MRLPAYIKRGTRAKCNVRGRIFTAEVLERTATGIRVDPPSGITYHDIRARDVTELHCWNPNDTQVKEGS